MRFCMRSRRSVTVKNPFHASPTPVSEVVMTPFTETLRHIDDLMAEARLLRERIAAALRREEAPFFPERRHRYEPHEPERRRTQ
jgi:hypothetical protein